MSFKEKSAWILVVVSLIIGGGFGWRLTQNGFDTPGWIFPSIVAFIVLVIILQIAVTMAAPKQADQSDERDQQIERRSENVGNMVLSGFVLLILAFAAINEHWYIANLAFLGLLISEAVKGLTQITLYRMGA